MGVNQSLSGSFFTLGANPEKLGVCIYDPYRGAGAKIYQMPLETLPNYHAYTTDRIISARNVHS